MVLGGLKKRLIHFIKMYNEDRDIGYFIEDDVQNPEKYYEIHKDFSFLPKRMSYQTCNN